MKTPTYVVRIPELEAAGHYRLRESVSPEWLTEILADTDVRPWRAADGGADEGRLELTLSKEGRHVLVRGRLQVAVTLPCARTLDPANYWLRPEVFLLLSPAPAGPGQETTGRSRRQRREEAEASTKGASAGKKGKKGGGDWSEDPTLGEDDAAVDHYVGDQVVLDNFLREFILLELPMFPVREDLRSANFDASSAHPSGTEAPRPASGEASPDGERPLDPRLSPLAEIKARLEKE